MNNPHFYNDGLGVEDGLPVTQGGRNGLRTGGLNGIHITGRVKISVPELLSIAGTIVLSVKGSRRPS